MIRVRQLAVRYGACQALAGVSLEARRGELLALAGPPRGGRTTLLRVLGAMIAPHAGTAEIDGFDVVKDRAQVRARTIYADGWLAAADGLDIGEYLRFAIGARSKARADAKTIGATAHRAQLAERRRVDSLEPSAKARLAIAAALAAPADILLLDEPLRAIESAARPIFVEWITERCRAGACIVSACGDASEGAIPADRAVVLEDGRTIARLGALAGAG